MTQREQRGARPTGVRLWVRLPPPVGGVTRSASDLAQALRSEPERLSIVDFGRPLRAAPAMAAGLLRPALNVLYASSPQSVRRYGVLRPLLRGPAVLFVHAGTESRIAASEASRTSIARVIARMDEVWVTNPRLRRWAASFPEAQVIRVVSPFVGARETARVEHVVQQRPVVVVACWEGKPEYNVDLALDAMERFRVDEQDAQLVVLLYGRNTPASQALEAQLAAVDWAVPVRDADEDRVASILAGADVLLRPSSTDGDSLIVRRALAAGLRVVATDVVPRPCGVELATLDADDIADALRAPNRRTSDGQELGEPVLSALRRLVEGERSS